MSDYQITVKDNSNTVLPGATITFLTAAGSVITAITSDSNGVVGLDLDQDGGLFSAGNTITVSKSGYATAGPYQVSQLQPLDDFILDKISAAAVVKSSAVPLLLIGGAVAAAFYFKKKKKVGAVDYSKYILPVGLLAGGLIIAGKLGLFSKSTLDAENSTLANQESSANAATLAQLAAAGQQPTASGSQLQGLASNLWSLGTSENSTSKASESVQDAMIEAIENVVNNTADWVTVKNYFGTKKAATTMFSTCYWFGTDCNVFNLDSFLQSAWDTSHISALNQYFHEQNISYQL